jgi:hypothetical protein
MRQPRLVKLSCNLSREAQDDDLTSPLELVLGNSSNIELASQKSSSPILSTPFDVDYE